MQCPYNVQAGSLALASHLPGLKPLSHADVQHISDSVAGLHAPRRAHGLRCKAIPRHDGLHCQKFGVRAEEAVDASSSAGRPGSWRRPANAHAHIPASLYGTIPALKDGLPHTMQPFGSSRQRWAGNGSSGEALRDTHSTQSHVHLDNDGFSRAQSARALRGACTAAAASRRQTGDSYDQQARMHAQQVHDKLRQLLEQAGRDVR